MYLTKQTGGEKGKKERSAPHQYMLKVLFLQNFSGSRVVWEKCMYHDRVAIPRADSISVQGQLA